MDELLTDKAQLLKCQRHEAEAVELLSSIIANKDVAIRDVKALMDMWKTAALASREAVEQARVDVAREIFEAIEQIWPSAKWPPEESPAGTITLISQQRYHALKSKY